MKLTKKELLSLTGIFFAWRAGLFLVALLASIILPASRPLFPYKNTLLEPSGLPSWIWGFGNFDGVHYLRIAMLGYGGSDFSQAFFPIFPLLIKLFLFLGNPVVVGLIIANIAVFLSTFAIYKLFRTDFDKQISFLSTILFLLFPTAYYLGSIYSESTFLLFVIVSLYFLKTKKTFTAALFAALAAATRPVGIFLSFVFLYEFIRYISQNRKDLNGIFKKALSLVISSTGLISYMVYLKLNFGSPFYFLVSTVSFHTGRENSIVLLPQVFFRYAKILISFPINSLPFFNASLEFLLTLIPLVLLFLFFKKMNKGYFIFTICALLLPTLTGTLSSMPRFALVSFAILPYIVKASGRYKILLIVVSAFLEIALTALFTRGYWIA